MARWREAAVAVALGAAVLAVFAPALDHGFVNYDDDRYVTANPWVLQGLTPSSAAWAFRATWAANWHPLTWLSHMLDVTLFGLDAGAHHRTSLLLHAVNAFLLYLWLGRLSGERALAALVALLFAVHPLRVESVAWIAERKDLLSACFGLLALATWTAWTRRGGAARYALALALYTASLASKPMLVTLPLLLLLLDFWPLERAAERSLLRRLGEKVPFVLLAAASAAVTVAAQRAGGTVGTLADYPMPVRLANAALAAVAYLRDLFQPDRLAVFYPHPGLGIDRGAAALAALALAAVTALALLARRRRPWLLMGWLWFLIGLVPVLGIVQVGAQARADRYTYLPLVGILVLVVWGGAELAERVSAARPQRGLAIAGVVALAAAAALGIAARIQTAVWRDSITLFEHALAVTGPNATAQLNLALALDEAGRDVDALAHLQRAVTIAPGWAKAHHNLGVAFRDLGRLAESERALARAIELDPGYAEAWNNLGVTLTLAGRPVEAEAHFARAAALDPGLADAQFNLGTLAAQRGETAAALARFERALALEPAHREALYNRAASLWLLGRQTEAREALARAEAAGFSRTSPLRTLMESGRGEAVSPSSSGSRPSSDRPSPRRRRPRLRQLRRRAPRAT